MPKEITHIYFADECLNKYSSNNALSSILKEHSVSFHFGSIAVDTFYYNIKIPFIDRDFFQWGDILHGAKGEKTSLPILAMLDDLKHHKSSPFFLQKLAFLCGFLSHFALDINYHPFVYAVSGNYYNPDKNEQVNAQMRHRLVEAYMDLYILSENKDNLLNFSALENISKQKTLNLELLKFLAKACAEAWKIGNDLFSFLKRGYHIQILLTSKLFKNHDVADFARFLNDIFSDGIRDYLALFYPETETCYPSGIIDFKSFVHPVTGEHINKGFEGLWQDAGQLCLDFWQVVEQYIFENTNKDIVNAVIKDYSLDVGLVGIKVNEARYFSVLNIVP